MQTYQECNLGYTFENESVCVFFGKIGTDIPKLQSRFKNCHFLRIKQTHSDIIVPASNDLVEADAHWTDIKNQALLISTADCIPLMLYNQKLNRAAAIHAGWKGVQNKICSKTLTQVFSKSLLANDFEFWFGPHILQDSFEIKKDTLDLLLQSSDAKDKSAHYFEKSNSYYLNLASIAKSQIEQSLRGLPKFSELLIDTKTSTMFHSYRRDHQNSGRNLSFIYLK
ncbi:MAG: hypothetical protein A2622_05595 [Bdellovibrionales bacterium RIFCSPHIGHO2_01_FULL_40_29]|nr:MAG: hypothetical protein A2622_05595 [Bdellovibrionales bacterium RIFCSPHIGHO2_01_FULL_40_29]OFZ33130.1 MAG: hypothetical protein A3D17_13275 [Bdellovibrionales bacterium RIFCSPHIGHO2_02_FULL_40_15]